MNPAVQTKGNDVSKFKAKGDNWKTTSGRQLGNNWNAIEKLFGEYLGTQATGSRQLSSVGVEWKTTGKESGKHIWNKTETSGKPHLQDKRETTR